MTDASARALLRRFGQFADRFADCFGRAAQRGAAAQYLDGLFNDSERKSMQAMHGRLSDPGSYEALQHFITDSPLEAEPLWRRLRDVTPERTGILALDDTSFPKQGKHSVGVKRQYCGALGKIANCQVAVSTVLLGEQLAWPLTFELYLPKEWLRDDARRRKARIPTSLRFREKWRIALSHIRRVRKAGFDLLGVVVDADYGSTTGFRRGLEQLGLRYGVAIRWHLTMWTPGARRTRTAGEIAAAIPEADWQQVTWAQGTKGPLMARFAAIRVQPAKSRGDRWLLCERALADDERKYYLLNLEATASLTDLVTLVRAQSVAVGGWELGVDSMQQPRTFRYEEDPDGVATITLDRPERLNALTFEVYAELRDLFRDLVHREPVRAVVITGAGRGFCSGGDVEAIIGELLRQDTARLVAFTRMTGALIANMRALPKPVVAAINGVAAGAGAVIALAADFRLAAPQASVAFLFTKVGLAGADMGAAYLLPRVIGLARATELLMLGDRVSADEALGIGLVNRVVPAESLTEEAHALAARLAAGPAFALGMTKTLLNQELDVDFAAAIEAEAQGQAICMLTPAFREAYDAFRARRS